MTTTYNFEKISFPTNGVPNNTCSGPDRTAELQIRLLLLQPKAYRKTSVKMSKYLEQFFRCLNVNVLFSVIDLPIFIVVKHRRHLDSSGDEGCRDEDNKITSNY